MILFYIYCVYFLWVFLMFVVCKMVFDRGRSFTIWGFVAYFLTPIVAIIFLLFMGKTEEEKEEQALEERNKERRKKEREETWKDWEELRAFRQKQHY